MEAGLARRGRDVDLAVALTTRALALELVELAARRGLEAFCALARLVGRLASVRAGLARVVADREALAALRLADEPDLLASAVPRAWTSG